jgi:hypothetical protein
MKNPISRNARIHGTRTSLHGSSPRHGHGFSRPTGPREDPRHPRRSAGTSPDPFAPDPMAILLELHALAFDEDRARSYLARPGCNVALGVAHRARTRVKRSLILRLLLDDRWRDDGASVRPGVSRHGKTGTPGGSLDRAEHPFEGSPARSPGRSRPAAARGFRGDE